MKIYILLYKSRLIGHLLHDDVILLLLQPKCFSVSLSWQIRAFAILNLAGIANLKYERKNEMNGGGSGGGGGCSSSKTSMRAIFVACVL